MFEQRDVLAEFSHLRDVAVAVAKLISDVRVHLSSAEGHLELEARLGKLRGHTFDPDVGHAAFCGILQLLESYPRWSRVSAWQETQDVFYHADLPGEGGARRTQIRTSVGVDQHGEVEIVHHSKERLRFVDMEMRRLDAESCAMHSSAAQDGFDARVAASLECPVRPELLPIAVAPDRVRIKQRKRFFLSSLGVDSDAFSFDLSIVYAGQTKSEAEQRQSAQQAPSFEVEIECLKPREYLRSSGGADIMLALSLILKCHDFSAALNPTSAVTYVPAS
jgi:hypothetical protein